MLLRRCALALVLLVALLLGAWQAPMATTLASPTHDAYFVTEIDGRIPATDSAAAATALSSGLKTDAGNINWAPGDPPDDALETLGERLRRDQGLAIGIVSTVPFNHATPAGFAAHNQSRHNLAEIAHEIIWDTTPEVVIGGGYDSDYIPATNPDYAALVAGATAYTHVVTRQVGVAGGAALAGAASGVQLSRGDRLFALFGEPNGAWTQYDVADAPGSPTVSRDTWIDPTLADAVTVTLPVLAQDRDGFLAMFEQGDIDWSNHAHDYRRMIGGMWDLDRAVAAATALIDAGRWLTWEDTLVVVTADHANGCMRLDREKPLGMGNLPQQVRQEGAWHYPDGEVSYGVEGHTNELVTLWARGAGAELFAAAAPAFHGTRILDNTVVPRLIKSAVAEAGARHVILFIGDGMHAEHEIAASRYLYGEPMALAWHGWADRADAWAGYCATWDVTTYNQYATSLDAAPFTPGSYDPSVGFDPLRGGCAPHPLSCAGNWPVLWARYEIVLPLALRLP